MSPAEALVVGGLNGTIMSPAATAPRPRNRRGPTTRLGRSARRPRRRPRRTRAVAPASATTAIGTTVVGTCGARERCEPLRGSRVG